MNSGGSASTISPGFTGPPAPEFVTKMSIELGFSSESKRRFAGLPHPFVRFIRNVAVDSKKDLRIGCTPSGSAASLTARFIRSSHLSRSACPIENGA